MSICGGALIVLGVLGLIAARDDVHRDGQILAIATGLIGLAFAHLFLPWAERRKERREST